MTVFLLSDMACLYCVYVHAACNVMYVCPPAPVCLCVCVHACVHGLMMHLPGLCRHDDCCEHYHREFVGIRRLAEGPSNIPCWRGDER